MAIINVWKGKNQIGIFSLTGDFITIGRKGDNDIVLPDIERKVSRYHALLIKNIEDPENYILRDLSSLWGTKVNGEYIFQKRLKDDDVIQIADFRLEYTTSIRNLKHTDSRLIFTFSVSKDIGDQSTIFQNLEEVLKPIIENFSSEAKILFEEMVSELRNYGKEENLFESAMDLLFCTVNMEVGSSGYFKIFDQRKGEKIFAQRGIEGRMVIPPEKIIQRLKNGQTIFEGNQLWIPILKGAELCLGFLYLSKGIYANFFSEKEIKIASLICQLIGDTIGENRQSIYDTDAETFFTWPRKMIGGEMVFKEIKRVANLDTNILILGETGVGKEIAAEEIHQNSPRKNKPFRKVNCPAIPKGVVESELFGHKKGAFTGAIKDKKGEFELANGGTIFLDEIGDLPWDLQRKILRVIREKVINKVGDEIGEIKVDVKIIAATNKDIQKEMEEGRFGSDLYYRFGERISIPPLRERKRDIPVIAHYLLDKHSKEKGLSSRGITAQAMRCLLSYSWPGNIGELEQSIKKALSKSNGLICLHHLPEEIRKSLITKEEPLLEEPKTMSLENMEKFHIMEVLNYCKGNKAKACKVLGISKPTLLSKIRKYRIPIEFGRED